ncbi:hypothetical protein TYRP_002168 [Tyrophagus putrescentiae]|nr:hypothetical protein TYRP_002168 [Tyrophagus putrescentiae]
MSKKQKLEQIAEDVMKLESASDLRIEAMSKEQFELQIASKLNNLTSQQLGKVKEEIGDNEIYLSMDEAKFTS